MLVDVRSLTLRNQTKPWRRKKQSEGATWTPEATPKDKGLRCKSCRKLQPWKKLGCTYEVDDAGSVTRLWVCECGNVLRVDNMDELMIKESDEEEEWQIPEL